MQPRSGKFPLPHQSKLQLQGWIFSFSYKQDKAGAALSIVTFWKGLENLWEATRSRIWEKPAQERERSEQGGCSCSPAGLIWTGKVSMVLPKPKKTIL